MNYEKEAVSADLILTAAIEDYAERTGQKREKIKDQMIECGAYDALYDFDTGLWTQGPDYFMDFFLKKYAAMGKR